MSEVLERPVLSRADQRRERNARAFERTRQNTLAKGLASQDRGPRVIDKTKRQRLKTGLEWLRDRNKLTAQQLRAGIAYGTIYRVACLPEGAVRISRYNDSPGGGVGSDASQIAQDTAAWMRDSRERLAALRASMGFHAGMIAACDFICGQGRTPRELCPAQRDAEQIECGLRIALDIAHSYFDATGWPPRNASDIQL